MKATINVMDHTGHSVKTLEGLSAAQVEELFWEIVRPASKGGKGMILAAGATLADMEQVTDYDQFTQVIADAEKAGQTATFLARGQVVGG